MRISYETGTDGFGGPPSDDDVATFAALVEHRLSERFPGYEVEVEVSDTILGSRVTSSNDDLDCAEVSAWIGNDVWQEWCSGGRAPA